MVGINGCRFVVNNLLILVNNLSTHDMNGQPAESIVCLIGW